MARSRSRSRARSPANGRRSRSRAGSRVRKATTPSSASSSKKKTSSARARSPASASASSRSRRNSRADAAEAAAIAAAAIEESRRPRTRRSRSRASRAAEEMDGKPETDGQRTVIAADGERIPFNAAPAPLVDPTPFAAERQRRVPRGYLSPQGLQQLKEYKYQSGFTGATDKYIMIPLWNWCLQFVPLWMAPNLLTVSSLLCGIACYFLFQFHSPDFNLHPPAWVFFLTSALMFLYLILDGLDGKQARRTGSSGPLGQLFDHGCDSICCFMCGIFMCSTLHLGGHRASAIVLLLHILPFYTSNWEEYCTGVMRFGLVGITEGQLLIIGLLAFTGVVGVDFWDAAMPIPVWLSESPLLPAFLRPSLSVPMERKFLLVAVGTLGVLYQVASSCLSVWEYHAAHRAERRTKKVYNKAKRMFSHHCLFLVCGLSWIFAPSPFFAEHPRLVLLTIGTLFGYQVSRLIISRVTKDPYPFFGLNVLFVPYWALILNAWSGEQLFDSYTVSIAYLAVIYLAYAHFVVLTINQICDFLGIRCFHIVPKKTDPSQH